jgi:outer membrane protein OmpA-like peptidoglycan-associated protein
VKQFILHSLAILICHVSYSQTSIKSFYFETSFSIPTEYSQKQLELFKEKLDLKEITIEKVYAYTDSIGSFRFNDSLAKRRLEYVVDALDLQNSSSIPKVAHGLNRIYDAQSFLNWRRVDVYYLEHKIELEKIIPSDTLIFIPIEVESKVVDTNHHEILASLDNATPYILNVEFFEGTANLDEKSMKEIRNLANFLSKNTSASILIRGHVCCGKNMTMSKKRAKTVYKELMKLGISKSRLDYIGMSNKEPLVTPELNDSDRQRNRRVDVKFQGM